MAKRAKKKTSKKKVTKTSEVTVADSREYTEEQIAAFQEECGKRPSFSIAEFQEVLLKPCEELTYKDIRIIISKVGWLSDDEKKKFKSILYEDNLTEDELAKYIGIYGNGHQFYKYFHKKEVSRK